MREVTVQDRSCAGLHPQGAEHTGRRQMARGDENAVNNESLNSMDISVDEKTESATPTVLMSERTWTQSDYVQEREKAAQALSSALGVTVQDAEKYIDDFNGIAGTNDKNDAKSIANGNLVVANNMVRNVDIFSEFNGASIEKLWQSGNARQNKKTHFRFISKVCFFILPQIQFVGRDCDLQKPK